ncbi:MAG: phosphatase [Clostridia bacterium]|nr:phosphatase [Clostridia bacterium]
MKIIVDTHTHTLASNHAFSTILENVEYAKRNGMKAIGFTDHTHGGEDGAHRWHFKNLKVLPSVINDIRVIKGAEANILNDRGDLDIDGVESYGKLELVIASIHNDYDFPQNKEYHTNAYLGAIAHPNVKIIGHPDDKRFDFDVEAVVKACKESGTAIELNNSSLKKGRADIARVKRILKACREFGTYVSCGTDAHFAMEVGSFAESIAMLEECQFPEKLILNTSVEKMLDFLGLAE